MARPSMTAESQAFVLSLAAQRNHVLGICCGGCGGCAVVRLPLDV
jgi:hypothetical protein